MIDFLSDVVPELSCVDAVTLSRWERSVTVPNQFRQSQVMFALGLDWYGMLRGKMMEEGVSRDNLLSPLHSLLSVNAFPPMLYSGGVVQRRVLSAESDEKYIEEILWRLSGYKYGVGRDVCKNDVGGVSHTVKLIKEGKKRLILTISEFGVVTGHALLGVCADKSLLCDYGERRKELFIQDKDVCLLLEGGYAGDAISFLKIFGFILSEICNVKFGVGGIVSFSCDDFLIRTLKNIGFRSGSVGGVVSGLQFLRGDAYASKKAVSLAMIEDCCYSFDSLFACAEVSQL